MKYSVDELYWKKNVIIKKYLDDFMVTPAGSSGETVYEPIPLKILIIISASHFESMTIKNLNL